MSNATSRVVVLLATILITFSELAWAQYPGGGFPGGGFPGGGYPRGDRGGRGAGDRYPQRGGQGQDRPAGPASSLNNIEYRLDMLQEDLRLTADQQLQWRAYAGKVLAYASDLARERSAPPAGASSGTNALQQIDRTVNLERNCLTALEDIASVAKVLYDSLTPEQRAVADARMAGVIPGSGAMPLAGGEGGFDGRRRPRGGEDVGGMPPGGPR